MFFAFLNHWTNVFGSDVISGCGFFGWLVLMRISAPMNSTKASIIDTHVVQEAARGLQSAKCTLILPQVSSSTSY